MADVFDAQMPLALSSGSVSLVTACLTRSSSTTASMMRSQPFRSAWSSVNVMRPVISAFC